MVMEMTSVLSEFVSGTDHNGTRKPKYVNESETDQQYHTSQTSQKAFRTDGSQILADCKVQKNNHTLNRKICMNFWAKSVEQFTYNSVLLSAQVNIKSKVWSHIHEKPEHW